MKTVDIYTDGACSGNPGPGGWAAVLKYNSAVSEISGSVPHTTNNRMELLAAVEALERLHEPCIVNLYTDSAYLANAINNGWLEKWKRSGWSLSKGGCVCNQELWKHLDGLLRIHEVHFIKVKGHSDNMYNNRCDELARAAINHIK